jgi:ABC-type transporter Mla MlaB component
MLKITGTTTEEQPILRLEGQVRGPWVEELRRACDRFLGGNGHNGTRVVLDLAGVSFIDAHGLALMRELTSRRILVTNCSPFVAEQLKEVADVDE